ncbi:NAD(P)-dependent oxidoreductase [Ktedonospora formicarum]|uniref:NAD(P)-binding domain-containing protein n=1 Tax=Ktedonospora formicarum TaxID=2778364 RepID=A0A8J3MTT1_9CHLR|nr:NAD(P)-dependent oxidoreductase [Ktedonospora formicarum]GHO46241.1 hypothetical protein KSX_44040 [Ktedonospora formicarum]
MKIAIFGVSGIVGQRVAREALDRGHEVKGIVRDTTRVSISHPNFSVEEGNIQDAASVARQVAGYDVIVNATAPRYAAGEGPQTFLTAANAVIEGVKQVGSGRLIVVGGAGSLEVAPGVQLVDTPDFPEAWKAGASVLRDALPIYKASDIDWTFFCPAALIQPGERTGKYRLGTDQLVTNEQGESSISAEDFAVALLDEVEKSQFIRRRFTAAY